MKKSDLVAMLSKFRDEDEIVICTQKRHTLYGNIGSIHYFGQGENEESDENPETDADRPAIAVIEFTNEGYSPEQALGSEWQHRRHESLTEGAVRAAKNLGK